MRIFWIFLGDVFRWMQKDSGFRFFVTIMFLIILVLGVVIFIFMKKG